MNNLKTKVEKSVSLKGTEVLTSNFCKAIN